MYEGVDKKVVTRCSKCVKSEIAKDFFSVAMR